MFEDFNKFNDIDNKVGQVVDEKFNTQNFKGDIVCSIKDIKANTFGNLFVQINRATAERYFDIEMKKLAKLGYQTTDFELYRIGFFDRETGLFCPDGEFLKGGYVDNE